MAQLRAEAEAEAWSIRVRELRRRRRILEGGDSDASCFLRDWIGGSLSLPIAPCRSLDLYDAYAAWARKRGTTAVGIGAFVQAATRVQGLSRRRILAADRKGRRTQVTVVIPPGAAPPAGQSLASWASSTATEFQAAIQK